MGLVLQRPFRFCLQEVQVFSGATGQHGERGHFLGTVRRACRGYPFQRNFTICNELGDPALQITCPFLSFGWNFTLRDPDGNELGAISKKWAGVAQELFTDADNFGVGFPRDMPSRSKALVLAAVFLIDFCFLKITKCSKTNEDEVIG